MDILSKRLTSIAIAIIVAGGVIIGLNQFGRQVGEQVSEKVPDLPSFSDVVAAPGEIVEAIVEKEPYEDISPAVVESVHTLAELTTVEYVEYTTIEKGTDESWLDWARGDSISMLAVAEIGAGVDLSTLTEDSFDVDTETGIVSFRLPPAEIHYAALDNEATHVYDRKTGLFTKGDDQLETEARQAAESALIQKALDEGILDDAEQNASDLLTELLLDLGYEQVVILPPVSPAPVPAVP